MIDPTSAAPAGPGHAPGAALAAGAAADPALRGAARAFEAAFLAEMLRHGGLGDTPEAFGGGAGEDQFAGLLRKAQAGQLADAGGIGLAEYIVTAMTRERHDERAP